MNKLPSTIMTALPSILGTIGAFFLILGGGYTAMAQTNPDVPALLGWPAGFAGILSTVGSFMVSLNNQKTAAAATPPVALKANGEAVDEINHYVSLAIAKATQEGKHSVARRLTNALDPEMAKAGQD